MRRLWQNERGVAAVELVLVTPILLAVLIGLYQFGSMMQTIAIVRNAARDGARYASVGWPQTCPASPAFGPCLSSSSNDVTHVVNTYLTDTLNGRQDVTLASAATAVCYPTPDPSCKGTGTPAIAQPAVVTVTLPITVLGNQVNLASSATMEILQVTS